MKTTIPILIVSGILIGCDDSSQDTEVLPYMVHEMAVAAEARSEPNPPDADAPTDFTETESGLRYRILRKSGGPKPDLDDSVRVYYKGWLDDGTVFDSSYLRKKPNSFGLTQVIAAWQEGLQLVGTGGMIELEVPPELGYGEGGFGSSIPPNARLHFIVELLQIEAGI